jgi:DNA-binding NarL/FixJ family response regulator
MLSVHDEDMRIVAAARAGAWGYIPKDADHTEFLSIIRSAYRGELDGSSFLVARLARLVSVRDGQEEEPGGGLPALTEREREILACAAAGCGNKEIADRLCVSSETVKTHLHHIYQKLAVSGRVEAVLTYLHAYKPAV